MLVKPLPNESGVLAALTPAVYARLTPNLKIVRLEAGSTLFDIDSISDQILTPIRYWLAHRRKRGGCVPRNPSNRKERSDGAGSFLRLGQSSSIEEVLEDFAKIAAAKGIRLFSVRFKRDRLERELKLPNHSVGAGSINELAACVEGGQTQLIVQTIGERIFIGGFQMLPTSRSCSGVRNRLLLALVLG